MGDEDIVTNCDEILSFLTKVSIFSSIGEQDLRRLADLLKSKQLPAGEIVIHQGDFGDSIYFICQGEVDIFIRNQEGAENTISHLMEGDFFGEMALLTLERRTATVTAIKSTDLLVLDCDDFHRFIDHSPEVGAQVRAVAQERAVERVGRPH